MLAALVLVLLVHPVIAQDEPYITHNTRPLITEGPYLVAPTQEGVSIVWKTDTDCHSRIEYGTSPELDSVAEIYEHGFVPIGTVHAIRLSGLNPGQKYHYKVVSTRVVKMKGYWPEKGLSIESPVYTFTVPSPEANLVTFSFLADTQHGDLRRTAANLDAIDWANSDFLVHGGDAFGAIATEEQLLEELLRPVSIRLDHSKPLVFARGNHDLRGAFARQLYQYFPTQTGEFYYSFDAGPVHFLVLDTGEDKDDDTNVYAGLNRTEPYREQEFAWLQEHVKTNRRIGEAPFRIILMHAPNWGWVDGNRAKWTDLANRAGVDLVISGHRHRFSWSPPGAEGREYGVLVVGQDQVGTVEASPSEIKWRVTDTSGNEVGAASVLRRE
jgi:predicted phosphodiesterase